MNRTASPQSPQRARSRLAFHASRIIIDVGVLVTLGAMSLRFVDGGASDVGSMAADALPALLLLIPIFIVTLIPDHSHPIPTPLGWAALTLGIAAFPYAIIKYIDAATLADTLDGSIGGGARLLVLGTGVTLVGIGVGLARSVMRLPQGGTYPARAAPISAPAPARRAAPGPGPAAASSAVLEGSDGRSPDPKAGPQENRPATPGDRLPRARRPILPGIGRPEEEDETDGGARP